jgi:cysteine desulfurase
LARSWIDSRVIVELRDEFWNALIAAFGARVVLHGHLVQRLPNTLNVGFRGRNGSEVLAAMPHIAASTGSACHAGATHISPVLAAMGVPQDAALGAIRFSLGRHTSRAEIDEAVKSLVRIIT